jgi:hypothetical protein
LALAKVLHQLASSNELEQIIAKFDEQEKHLLLFHTTFDLATYTLHKHRGFTIFARFIDFLWP